MAKVLFVNAPHTDEGEELRRFSRPWPPLDLLNCAAIARRDGHEVALMDFRARRFHENDVARRSAWSDVVVVTTTPLDRWQCPTLNTEPLFRFVRRFPSERTWVAGAHATMRPEWTLEQTGALGVVAGEPESSIARILSTPDSGDRVLRGAPIEMADLPIPAFDLLAMEDYRYELMGDRFMLFEASRGCPFACTFCSREMYGRPVRRKPVAQVMDEVDAALASPGFSTAYFIDLEFTFHRKPVVELCEEILKRNARFAWTCQTRFDQVDEELLRLMRRAGCALIHFGVESGSPEIAVQLRKGLELDEIRRQHALVKRTGIRTALFFLMGHPGETNDQRGLTVDFACELAPDYASFHIASPYPGTEFHDSAGPFDSPFPAYDDRHHRLEDLERSRRAALRRFYLRPAYLASLARPTRWRAALRGAMLLRKLLS